MKKKIHLITLLFIIFINSNLYAQNPYAIIYNEMMYWKLRGRLIGDVNNIDRYNGFLSIGEDAGQSIPSSSREINQTSWQWFFDPDQNGPCRMQYLGTIYPDENGGLPHVDQRDGQPLEGIIEWGDATIELGNYLGVLATEWKLLNRAGNSTVETERELYYALKALERLDKKAETLYGSSEDLNGFFVRDDVPELFAINHMGKNFDLAISEWNCYTPIDNPTQPQKEEKDCDDKHYNISKLRTNAMSQDQAIGLLMGFALIRKFVPNWVTYNGQGLLQMAKDHTDRIVKHIRKSSDTNWWFINDPVTNKAVCRGASAITLSFPIAQLGQYITGTSYHNPVSWEIGFKIWRDVIKALKLNSSGDFSYNLQVPPGVASIIGVPTSFNVKMGYKTKPYNLTMFLKLAACSGAAHIPVFDTKGKKLIRDVSIDNNKQVYDLLGSVMLGYDPYIDVSLWHHFLGAMNCSGNCYQINNPAGFLECNNYGTNSVFGGPWNVPNRWDNISQQSIIDAQTIVANNPPFGQPGHDPNVTNKTVQYPGLDYLLAHNLYRLKYYSHGYQNKIRRNVDFDFPSVYHPAQPAFGGGLPDVIVGNDAQPFFLKAVFSINANNSKVEADGNANFTAGSNIKLNPGFHALPGSVFSAKINEYDCTPSFGSVYGLYKNDTLPYGFAFHETDTTLNMWTDSSDLVLDFPPEVEPSPVIETWVGDSLYITLNPDYIFTDDGQIIYAPDSGSYKAAFEPITFKNLTLYPNPTSQNIFLEYTLYTDSEIRLKVTSELGQELSGICEKKEYHQTKGKHKLTLQTSNLASGIYFCIIEINGTRKTLKFTVSK